MREPTMICDLFEWLPPWGEFELRPAWSGHDFVVNVDYETGTAAEPGDEILTKVVTFDFAVATITGLWPDLRSLPPDTFGGAAIDRGQIYDLGSTALLDEIRRRFRDAAPPQLLTEDYPDFSHYYVHFEDMKKTFQAVAGGVAVSDGAPPEAT